MKRVYTDDRFPGTEVTNFGGTQFTVLHDHQPIDEFTACETESSNVSEAFAQRRATDYFQRLAEEAEGLPVSSSIVDDLPQIPDKPVSQQVADYLLEF